MRILIIGAGVTGLASAYYLSGRGHEVTLVDENEGAALGASYANGAQLSYSYVAPLAGPGVLPKVPPWLLRRDAPLRFMPAPDPDQWRWLWAFIRACTPEAANLTTRRLLALSFHSRRLMHEFVAGDGAGWEFGYATNGKLVVYSDPGEFASAKSRLDYQRSLGCEQQALNPEAVRALEPALQDTTSALGQRMVGAIYTPSEEVGDCYLFCKGMEALLAARGVRFLFSTRVVAITTAGENGPVTGIETQNSNEVSDAVVIASGAGSANLARPLGIRLPVYPLKGYSITVPAGRKAPAISITDASRKIVYAPLVSGAQTRLRVAGMADIVGHDPKIDPVRLDQLVREAREAFPSAAANGFAHDTVDAWAGLRPATPWGTPIIGATPRQGLYVNIGQGALGWTLALGSGQVLADMVDEKATQVTMDGMTYASAGR